MYEAAGVDPLYYDDIPNNSLIMYGIPNFDHFWHAIVTIFQVLTLESWSYLMYNYADANSPTMSVIFFVTIVIMGSLFTMNLVLAMIIKEFIDADDKKKATIQKGEKKSEKKHGIL